MSVRCDAFGPQTHTIHAHGAYFATRLHNKCVARRGRDYTEGACAVLVAGKMRIPISLSRTSGPIAENRERPPQISLDQSDNQNAQQLFFFLGFQRFGRNLFIVTWARYYFSRNIVVGGVRGRSKDVSRRCTDIIISTGHIDWCPRWE